MARHQCSLFENYFFQEVLSGLASRGHKGRLVEIHEMQTHFNFLREVEVWPPDVDMSELFALGKKSCQLQPLLLEWAPERNP